MITITLEPEDATDSEHFFMMATFHRLREQMLRRDVRVKLLIKEDNIERDVTWRKTP